MSKEVFTQVIRGAHEWVRQAEEALEKELAEHGPDTPIGEYLFSVEVLSIHPDFQPLFLLGHVPVPSDPLAKAG